MKNKFPIIKRCLPLLALYVFFVCGSVNLYAAADTATVKKLSVTDKVIGWYNRNLNYGTITLLMAVESSFIPFPSEVIVPPAAYQACNSDNPTLYRTDSKIANVIFVILFSTLGALIGALVNYVLSVILGRPIIYWFADSKVGHLLLLDSHKIKRAEDYFIANGNSSTFIGRLIPGIRQLISIPAGLAKMNIFKFILYTSLGATVWNTILAFLGYFAHGQQDLIEKYNDELKIVLWGVFVLFIVYLVYKGVKSSKKNKKTKTAPDIDSEKTKS